MKDIDGGLHPAVDGQTLDEDDDEDEMYQVGCCIYQVGIDRLYIPSRNKSALYTK